jgi:CheY-like chemotaxis protein
VELTSEPGKGALFRLCFPNIPLSARLPVTDIEERGGATNFNEFTASTLLVVDDNAANRELLAGIFEGTNHSVVVARGVDEALVIIGKTKVDLILVDIRMPGMDGNALLAEIRRRPGLETLPVIAVTASTATMDESDLRARFSGFLRKPFTRQALCAELAQFLPRINAVDRVRPKEIAGSPAPPPPSDPVAGPEALVSELRALGQAEWPALRESLAINETVAFARKLRSLGARSRLAALVRYAGDLETAAEAYSVAELERRLAEFPKVAQSVEQSLGAPQ